MSDFSTTIQSPKVTVDGMALDQFWANKITSISVEMQFQVPTRLTLRFETDVLGEQVPSFPFELDRTIVLSFPVAFSPDGSPSFVSPCGKLHVTEIGVEHSESNRGELIVVAHDASFHLTRRHTVSTFADMTISDIVKQIGSRAGLQTNKVEATSDVLKYLLQADTDFGFISTLARRVGFDWWVDDDSLIFSKRPATPTKIEVGVVKDLISFSVSQHALATKKVKVRGWDRDQQAMVTAESTPEPPLSNQIQGMSRAKNGVRRSTDYSTSSIRAESVAEAGSLAKAIGERVRSSAVDARGEVYGNPNIRPGVVLEVIGQHLAGSYAVTQVEHRYTNLGYRTRFCAGDRVPSGLADLIGGGTSGEQFGAYTGLPALIPAKVTTIGTEEFLGRVKVTFPYLSEENSSHWARVLSAGGGPERGFWFLPEVGDEVLVAFEGGDTRFPVVMGGLYGKVTTPESQLVKDGKINSRSVRSRLGHYMDFVDGTDDKTRHIAFGLGDGGKPGTAYKMRIGEDRFDIEVPEGTPIAIKAGAAQITFTQDKSIEIAAENITIKATDKLDLEGKSVTIKGTQDLAISQGGNKLEMASGGLDMKGSPQTNIKGGPKVNIG